MTQVYYLVRSRLPYVSICGLKFQLLQTYPLARKQTELSLRKPLLTWKMRRDRYLAMYFSCSLEALIKKEETLYRVMYMNVQSIIQVLVLLANDTSQHRTPSD